MNTFVLGKIPLPRKLQPPHEKYELGFYATPEGNLRLTQFAPPEAMFDNYSYRSSFVAYEHVSKRMTFAERLYRALVGRASTSVCEVACNDGYMLNRYVSKSYGYEKVVGIEPAKNLHKYIDERVTVYGKYMNKRTGISVCEKHGAFDLIFAANCVAHTPEPMQILRGIEALMNDDSVLVVQFQYLKDMIDHNQFYHLYHEHYHYFSLGGFARLAKRAGLTVVAAEDVPEQGGSMLCGLVKSERERSANVDSLIEAEAHYTERAILYNFAWCVDQRLRRLVKWVNAQRKGSLHGIFASAKATVILNLAIDRGLEVDRFAGFYDDAEELWGWFVPGTQIPIGKIGDTTTTEGDKAILFAPSLMDVAQKRLPGVEITNVEDILNG